MSESARDVMIAHIWGRIVEEFELDHIHYAQDLERLLIRLEGMTNSDFEERFVHV